MRRPRSVVARYGTLTVLHQNEAGAYLVSTAALAAGVPQGALQPLFTVPAGVTPFDLEQDSHGRFYLSDPAANKVYQLDRAGRSSAPSAGSRSRNPAAMIPKPSCRRASWPPGADPEGNDRLLVVDQAGPTNTSEWSAEGKLLRQFIGLQTNANNYGYAIDPEHPEDLYIRRRPGVADALQNGLCRGHVQGGRGVAGCRNRTAVASTRLATNRQRRWPQVPVLHFA